MDEQADTSTSSGASTSREAREAAKQARVEAKDARLEARQAKLQARTSAQQARIAQVEQRTETRTKAQRERRAAARAQRQAEQLTETVPAGEAGSTTYAAEGGLLHYAVIDRLEAPPQPPAPRGRMVRALTGLVDSLGPGLVARIEPKEGERPRKIVANLYQVAGRIGKPVTTWEDQGFIYVELLDIGSDDAGDAEPAAAPELATAEAVDEEIVDGALVEDEILDGELIADDADEDGPDGTGR